MPSEYPDKETLLSALGCGDTGLSSDEAQDRRQRFGPNRIAFHRRRSPLRMLAAELVALFPLLLLGASALAFVAHTLSPGEGYELIAAALLLVVVLNASVSFVQNYKVEKLMVSFLDYIPKEVVLLRDGEKVLLDAQEAVPGDLLFIQEGDKIPADGVLISADNLVLDESILTGESEPLAKVALTEEIAAECRVNSGATVLSGHATVLVTRTGRETTLGATIVFSQIGNVMACRTSRQSAVPPLFAPNRWIVAGIVVEVLFILLVVYIPPLHHLFNTAPFPVWAWGLILMAPLAIFAIEEGRKYLVRHGAGCLSA